MWIKHKKMLILPFSAPSTYLYRINPLQKQPIRDLQQIAILAAERLEENDRFARQVKSNIPEQMDAVANRLNRSIEKQIDCTVCGNCCKSLMINVSESEADTLSAHLEVSRASFDETYLEKGNNGMMLMNAIPCTFLEANRCNVYEHRFEGCREFPAMHLPGFSKRLFTTLMHYGRCPIIFNIVEEMKDEMGFVRDV
jgi:uncharacterized protein